MNVWEGESKKKMRKKKRKKGEGEGESERVVFSCLFAVECCWWWEKEPLKRHKRMTERCVCEREKERERERERKEKEERRSKNSTNTHTDTHTELVHCLVTIVPMQASVCFCEQKLLEECSKQCHRGAKRWGGETLRKGKSVCVREKKWREREIERHTSHRHRELELKLKQKCSGQFRWVWEKEWEKTQKRDEKKSVKSQNTKQPKLVGGREEREGGNDWEEEGGGEEITQRGRGGEGGGRRGGGVWLRCSKDQHWTDASLICLRTQKTWIFTCSKLKIIKNLWFKFSVWKSFYKMPSKQKRSPLFSFLFFLIMVKRKKIPNSLPALWLMVKVRNTFSLFYFASLSLSLSLTLK